MNLNPSHSFKMFDFYNLGLPLYWRNEETGVLPAAVWAFVNHMADSGQPAPAPAELALVVAYCRYFINAPCWNDAGVPGALAELRWRVRTLQSVAELSGWIDSALEIALDPL